MAKVDLQTEWIRIKRAARSLEKEPAHTSSSKLVRLHVIRHAYGDRTGGLYAQGGTVFFSIRMPKITGQIMRPLQIIFSAECTDLFDWQSAGLFHSFHDSNNSDTAEITRLLACSDKQQETYADVNLQMGPTIVHRNMRDDPLVDEKGYASYNKPFAAMSWLQTRRPIDDGEDEFVLMMDSDMLLRGPIDPIQLGCRRGVVVSAEYAYLIGTKNGLAERFLPPSHISRLAQVGGFHIFHREDLRVIAPRWLEYTKRVRAFAREEAATFFELSMVVLPPEDEAMRHVRRNQTLWHSEMYGYVFAAAESGVRHRVRRDTMLYPSYEPYLGRPPLILHYGVDYSVRGAYFNKMNHAKLSLNTCPAMQFSEAIDVSGGNLTKKEALCVEHLAMLDVAFCHMYRKSKCAAHQIPTSCTDQRLPNLLRETRSIIETCADQHANCDQWARENECSRNPLFMHSSCPRSCGSCSMTSEELGERTAWYIWEDIGDEITTESEHSGGWLAVMFFIACIYMCQLRFAKRILVPPAKLESKCAV